jgi:hypothetical protein
MSRFDSDVDAQAWLNGDDLPPNAVCADCGVDYSKADHDLSALCDACSDKREAWATATAVRMVKAAIARPRTKEIA